MLIVQVSPPKNKEMNDMDDNSDNASTQSSPAPSITAVIKRHKSIGTIWSTEISNLRNAGSVFEVALCLRHVSEVLDTVDRADRIKYCKQDFVTALQHLRSTNILLTDKVLQSITRLSKRYFDECLLDCIPEILMQEIFMMIPFDECSVIPSVCQEWKSLWKSDIVWKTLYKSYFISSNPTSMPTSPRQSFYTLYKDRLANPQVGDHVEVSWRGKFRLEANNIYQGLAWWVGVVVATGVSSEPETLDDCFQSYAQRSPIRKFKIHYPGWESRWDEWVDRDRLRWPMKQNDATSAKICKGDTVELWCCGFNVPGAWLESVVKRVKKDRFCVTRAHVSGSIWVPRERIRPQKRKTGANMEQLTAKSPSNTKCVPGCKIM